MREREREREREITHFFVTSKFSIHFLKKYFQGINIHKNNLRQRRSTADTNLICYIRAVFCCIFIIVHIDLIEN